MKRRAFGKSMLTAAPLALATFAAEGRARANSVCAEQVTEYRLPPAIEPHEMVRVPDTRLLLVTQRSTVSDWDPTGTQPTRASRITKVMLDPDTEAVVEARQFELGTHCSGAHGLALSAAYPGQVWCTIEYDSAIVRLDPRADDPTAPPKIVQRIDLPAGALGPHRVAEYGSDLWATLRGSFQVLRISFVDPADYTVYDAAPEPVFVAKHPITGEFFAGQDRSSEILRIEPATGRPTRSPSRRSRAARRSD